jgi:hypothetical protein
VPEWFTNIVAQFPVVALVGFVAWIAYKEVRNRHAEEIKRLEANHQSQLNTLQELMNKHLESKNDEIDRLSAQHRGEMQKLTKKVDELIKRLDDHEE